MGTCFLAKEASQYQKHRKEERALKSEVKNIAVRITNVSNTGNKS